jgi:hypothetical protein
MTILSTMAAGATTSKTCRKVFSFHKLINALRKSRENMTLPIAGKESLNSVSRKPISPTTRKTKITALLISKQGSQLSLPKRKVAMQE